MSRKLNDWITSYLEYTEETEPPFTFRLWSAISTIAACLQRKCKLPWGLETFHSNIYVVLVGNAASRKGTALQHPAQLLYKLGIKTASDAVTKEALVKGFRKAVTSYFTPEGEQIWHSSLTIMSGELTVFLGYRNLELMANLCDWYDCGKTHGGNWIYETVGRGEETITNIWSNLIGCTTPDNLQEALPMSAIGSGLTSRIIFVYENKQGKKVIMPYGNPELWDKLIHDLEYIHIMKGDFKTTPEFFTAYSEWYGNTDMNVIKNPRFDAYCARRANHLFKVAMVCSASRSNDLILTKADFDRALSFLELTEKKMELTFSGIGKSNLADITDKVLLYMAANKEVTLVDLQSRFYRDADKDTLMKVIKTLHAMEQIKLIHRQEGVVVKFMSDNPMFKN